MQEHVAEDHGSTVTFEVPADVPYPQHALDLYVAMRLDCARVTIRLVPSSALLTQFRWRGIGQGLYETGAGTSKSVLRILIENLVVEWHSLLRAPRGGKHHCQRDPCILVVLDFDAAFSCRKSILYAVSLNRHERPVALDDGMYAIHH